MIDKKNVLFAVLALGVLVSSGCRSSRTTRNNARNRTTPPAPATNGNAKAVLTEADSALARVAALAQEDEAPPPAQMDRPMAGYPPMGRTPWGAPGQAYVPRPDPAEYGLYEAALGAYNGHQYDQAIGLLSQVVNSGRPPELIPNAYYWMGESFYAMGRYAESKPYFEYVTKVGPQYKREMALYKLSRADLHLGNKQGANLWYERLRSDYPRSGYIKTLRRLGTR